MVFFLLRHRACRHSNNSFACAWGNFLCVDLLSSNKYICCMSTSFVIVDNRSKNNSRSMRRYIFYNPNTWGKVMFFCLALDSCCIFSIIVWYSSWYYPNWGHPEKILEQNNLHAPMFAVLLCTRYRTLSSLSCFSVGRIVNMMNRKQCTVNGLRWSVDPPNILLQSFEKNCIMYHVTHPSQNFNFDSLLSCGNRCHHKTENGFNGYQYFFVTGTCAILKTEIVSTVN